MLEKSQYSCFSLCLSHCFSSTYWKEPAFQNPTYQNQNKITIDCVSVGLFLYFFLGEKSFVST
jgi:hypothetical protein